MSEMIVYEGFGGYYLKHLASGRVACMGDGVDQGLGVWPGTPTFVGRWQADVDANEAEYQEAYFADQD